MVASILNVAQNIGYPMLVMLVLAESAGIPLPGETAIITAAALAGQHRLQLPLVILLAATAAIVGDNLGYLVGRKGGRWLLQRPGPFDRPRVLETGEPFFIRHGPKAVFLGRWILGLRTWASWLAGASRMPWHSSFLWNAAGGISWATTLSIVAYSAIAQLGPQRCSGSPASSAPSPSPAHWSAAGPADGATPIAGLTGPARRPGRDPTGHSPVQPRRSARRSRGRQERNLPSAR